MKFLKLIADRQREQTQGAVEEWRALVNRAVTKDDLKPAEAVRLAELHTSLNYPASLEELAQDLAAYYVAKDEAERQAKAEAAMEKAQQSIHRFDVETTKIIEAHDALMKKRTAERESLDRARIDAETAHACTVKAAVKMGELKKRQWQFFGCPDPAIEAAEREQRRQEAAKIRYVIHGTAEEMQMREDARDPRILVFEHTITSAARDHLDLEKVQFVPLEEQDEDEFREMAAALQDPRPRRYAYLRHRGNPTDYGYRAITLGSASGVQVVFFEDVIAMHGQFDPGRYCWLKYPGQQRKELDSLLGKLEAGWAEYSGRNRAA